MNIKGVVDLVDNFEYKTANPQFYNYIGSMTYSSSLLNLIHEDDREAVKNDILSVKGDRVVNSVARLNTEKNGYKWFYLSTRLGESEQQVYTMELTDIDELMKTADRQDGEIKNYRAILTSDTETYFDYRVETDTIKLFKIKSDRTFDEFEGNLNDWASKVIEENNIQGSGIQRMNKLCDSLKHAKKINDVINLDSKDGKEPVSLIVKGSPVCAGDGITRTNVLGRIYVSANGIQDNTENNKYDDLTGLLTKNTIRRFAERSIYENKDKLCSLVILDIDNFKAVNDTYGHMFGDEVIVRIADIITGIVGKQGVVGRFGGDEFFIVLDSVKDNAEVRSILRSIRMNVYETRFANNPTAVVSCSIGSAVYPVNGGSFDIIFKKADKALYLAKEKGRNRYIIYDEAIHGELEEEEMVKSDKKVGKDINKSVFNLIDVVNQITDEFMKNEVNAVQPVIDYISELCEVRRINVYYGSDLKKIYTCGDTDCSEITYADENYFKLFNDSGILIMNFTYKLEFQHPAAYQSLSEQGVCSSIQCIIGDKENIRGIVSFENCTYDKMFSQNDTLLFALFANMLGHILDISPK